MEEHVMHPSQFKVNEVWIVFRLNDAPIVTARDGAFNCIALMDAASCFILVSESVPVDEPEPSVFVARRMFETAWGHKKELPATLYVPDGQFQTILPAEAKRRGISVVRAPESQLRIFISDARQSFREYMQRRRR